MEHSLLQEMYQRIDAYEQSGVFQNKFVVIFGSNEAAEKMMDYLGTKNIVVNAIVDNNIKKDGTLLFDIPVMLPDKCLSPKRQNTVILIASRYYSEMVMQLEAMGYHEKTEILKMAEYSVYNTNSLTEAEFENRVEIIKKGEQVFQKLFYWKADTEKLFVSPPAALGDAYVGMSFLRQYNQYHGIHEFTIVTRNRACEKVAYLFGYEEQTITIEKSDMDALLQYAAFSEMAEGKILVMSHRFPYTCRLGEIGNYKGIHFVDHFCYSIFQLGDEAKPEAPYVHRNDESSILYVDKLFFQNELPKGNTVILFPYATTASGIDINFWITLAERLVQQGFMVCTNSNGDAEPAITGTRPLFFDLRYALEVTEAAGYMVALRSGICDVLSAARARKIIIYPDRIYGPGSFISFYNLVNMGLSSDADELVWNGTNEVMAELVMSRIC